MKTAQVNDPKRNNCWNYVSCKILYTDLAHISWQLPNAPVALLGLNFPRREVSHRVKFIFVKIKEPDEH